MTPRLCRTPRCTGAPAFSRLWCDDCLPAWDPAEALPIALTPVVVAVEPVPPLVQLDLVPDGFHRCSNCTGLYPVLVDDALCIRCDSILYPTSTIPAAAAWTEPLREAS